MPAPSRDIRCFISSTFKDFQEERSHLVKAVFPFLRTTCQQRGGSFTEIDLRWGISVEDAISGRVVSICLEQIDLCRPYFIGMCGERYGWIPPKVLDDWVQQFPFLAAHTEPDTRISVTEMEVRYGTLLQPDAAQHAFFYFRRDGYRPTAPEFVANAPFYPAESPESTKRVADLKRAIVDSGLPTRTYSSVYEVGAMILQDLTRAIEHDMPLDSAPSEIEMARAAHRSFAETRRRVYVGKASLVDRMTTLVHHDSTPILVLSSPGYGKSAFLANWITALAASDTVNAIVVYHFIGSSQESAVLSSMLLRLINEIKDVLGLDVEVPLDPLALIREFGNILDAAATTLADSPRKLVLVLDGLDFLENPADRELSWLPTELAPSIQIVGSCSDGGPVSRAAADRNWRTLEIAGLSTEARTELTRAYLDVFSKKLSDDQMALVTSTAQTAQPLYLRALLEEIRLFGVFEELSREIARYAAAQTVTALFALILERLEVDFKRDTVREFFTLIAVSRHGVTESELKILITAPPAEWIPLRISLAESLFSRSGRLNFAHEYLKAGVQRRYLAQASEVNAVRQRFVAYFGSQEPAQTRTMEELPFHLQQLGNKEQLVKYMREPRVFMAMYSASAEAKFRLFGFWRSIDDAYNAAIEHYNSTASELLDENRLTPAETRRFMSLLAAFCAEVGHYREADLYLRRAVQLYEKADGCELDAAECKYRRANLFITNDFKPNDVDDARAEARRLLDEARAVLEAKVDGPHRTKASIYFVLGWIDILTKKLPSAAKLLGSALEMRRTLLGAEHPDVAQVLEAQGRLAHVHGDLDDAERLCQTALSMKQRLLGSRHQSIANVLRKLASIALSRRHYDDAVELYGRARDIVIRAYGKSHPLNGIFGYGIASALRDSGNIVRAKDEAIAAIPVLLAAFGKTPTAAIADLMRRLDVILLGHDVDWFHGLIDRKDSIQLLDSAANGAFLARSSSRGAGNYAISCRVSNKVVHYLLTYEKTKRVLEVQTDAGVNSFGTIVDVQRALSGALSRPLSRKAPRQVETLYMAIDFVGDAENEWEDEEDEDVDNMVAL